MEKKSGISLPAIGGSSLLTVFAVLCLTVLALLSLTTARAERRLAQASTAAMTDWYRADTEAQTIFARLRAGEVVSGVSEENGAYHYSCPISHSQDLAVALEKNGENWTVLRWQAVPRAQSPEEDLPLWDGGGIP